MTSSSGYYPYLDLVQAYSLNDLRYVPRKNISPYPEETVMGWLSSQQNEKKFSIFIYLLRTAKMDMIASQPQYNSTLFACPDYILRERYGEDFFMNLERGSITKLMNIHTLPRVIHMKSLYSQTVSILETRDKDSTLTITNTGDQILLNGAGNNGDCKLISGEFEQRNGSVYVIDDLLIPENF
jgi:uncharacterized surface protein with fasciclin (FAS1) repeats